MQNGHHNKQRQKQRCDTRDAQPVKVRQPHIRERVPTSQRRGRNKEARHGEKYLNAKLSIPDGDAMSGSEVSATY